MRPTIGVIGGLGPAATADFFTRIVAASPAETDQDHLHLIIDSDPSVPDRNDGISGRGPSPGPALTETAMRLKAAGANVLVMPCNAAHVYVDEIQAAVNLPLLSIIDATVTATLTACPKLELVSVLAAEGTLRAQLYHRAFGEHGVDVIAPEDRALETFMAALYAFKASGSAEAARGPMQALALEHVQAGAGAVVAGCTEVPMILGPGALPCPLISSTDSLVDAVIAFGYAHAP